MIGNGNAGSIIFLMRSEMINTKEAIEFIREHHLGSYTYNKILAGQYENIIKLLQYGEAYKEMWEGLRLGLDIPKLNLLVNGEDICKTMKDFEQRYLPKVVK